MFLNILVLFFPSLCVAYKIKKSEKKNKKSSIIYQKNVFSPKHFGNALALKNYLFLKLQHLNASQKPNYQTFSTA
jgi:hypothetical protein